MLDRTHLGNIDWILIGLLLLNSFIGVAIIYSSSHYLPGDFHMRQIFWIGLSLTALFIFISFDYNFFLSYSFYFYFFCILILIGILIFGKWIAGAKSWIKMPFFQIQPSELTKIALILVLAHIFSGVKRTYLSMGEGFLNVALVFSPVLFVALQPDLGTALSYVPIFLATLILAGINRTALIFLLILALLVGIFGWNYFLKDYQKQRVKTLLSPTQDPLGSGYHILQSKIAVGSGGLLGKGYKKGTQSQLRFLPARHTDFVFSVIGEEFGFIGVILAMLFYYLLLARLFQSIKKSRDRAGVYLIFMVAMMLTCQFFINVLMVIGLFPVTGIPLPFLSYGGSSLLTNYLAVALVINVKMRRFVNI